MNTTALPATLSTRVLTWCMHLLIAGLLVLIVIRAVAEGPSAAAISGVALLCGAVYAGGAALPAVRDSARASAIWLAVVCAIWVVLLVLTADAVWIAFPLYFLQLHLLPRAAGLAAVVGTALVAILGFSAHQASFGPAMAIGPALGAAVAVAVVWGYQALYQESEQRGRLIEELTTARADLAEAEHRAGVLAEQILPVRLVALLGVGQGRQDLPLLAAGAPGQVAVDLGLAAFFGERGAPPPDLRGGRGGVSCHPSRVA